MSHLWDTRAQPSAEGGSWFQHPEDALLTLAHHVPPLPESPSPAPQAPWPNWNNRPCSGCLCFPHSHLSSPLVSLQSCFQRSEELAPLLATILPILPKPHSYPDGWYPGFQSPDLPLCDHHPPPAYMPPGSQKDFSKAYCPREHPSEVPAALQEEVRVPWGSRDPAHHSLIPEAPPSL